MGLHAQLDDLIHRVLPVVQDFHSKGMLAPHAATIDHAGNLTGHALTTDGATQLSVSQTIAHFENRFATKAKSAQILATGIFYHASGIRSSADGVSLPPADTVDQCNMIVALLEHAS